MAAGAGLVAALISDLAPPGGAGKTMGVMATAQGIGAFSGPLASGYLWDVDIHYPFIMSAGSLTLAALVALVFIGGNWGQLEEVGEEGPESGRASPAPSNGGGSTLKRSAPGAQHSDLTRTQRDSRGRTPCCPP
jgi:MFS family permease